MLFLVIFSANPFAREHAVIATIIGAITILILYPKTYILNLKKEIVPLIIILFFVSFDIIHRFIFKIDNTMAILKVLSYFLFSYFCIKAIKFRFIYTYIKVVYSLSLLSLILYVLISFFPSLYTYFEFGEVLFPLKHSNNPTILIYTFDSSFLNGSRNFVRNPGFSWEAGGFATYLNIALLLHVFSKNLSIKKIFTEKVSVVLIISILSTLSTAGYLALFIILISSIITIKAIKKYFYFLIISLIAYGSLINLEFLGEKINYQIEVSEKSQNRIGSAYLDWQDIKNRPLTGWSRKETVLFGKKAHTYTTHRPNGLTNYLRSYGFIYVFFLFFLWFLSFKNVFQYSNIKNNNIAALTMLFVIFIMSFSQLIFDDFIFRSFLFLFLVYKEIPRRSLSNSYSFGKLT